jgi:phosphohistidine swiveling domain-containing protein
VPRYTTFLDEIDSSSIPLVGGKGANLGELTKAALPVPKAFCVTTDAYRAFIDASGLQPSILGALEGLNYDDVTELERRAAGIRQSIVDAEIPADIAAAIRQGYAALEAELGAEPSVSIRSSATAEDLPGTSFAGQQDTYLHIAGIGAVLHHVKRCWASLWTDRAISYRHRQGFAHADVLLAVVVQEMFPSEVAGVMFTANPVNGNPGEIFLNTSWGLGEAIVSGRVNPDQYIVLKDGFAVRERIINDKQVMTVRRDDGVGSTEAPVPADKRTRETLSESQLRELAAIGTRIERHYGFPQDIEWGFSQGRFAILQSREITAVDLDFPEGMEAWQTPGAFAGLYDERWVWSRAYSDEVQTGPSTPYFYSILERGMTMLKWKLLDFTDTEEWLGYARDTFQDIPLYRWYGARAYYNAQFERERIRRFIPPFARDDAALWPFPAEEREEIRNMPFNWMKFIQLIVRLHFTRPKVALLNTPKQVFDNLERWTDYTQSVWDQLDLEAASVREIFDTEIRAIGDSEFGANVTLPFTIYLFVLPAALRTLCAQLFDDQDERIYTALVSGLFTKTSEENVAVWKLAQVIRRHPALLDLVTREDDHARILASLDSVDGGAEFKEHLAAFLKEYGHRGGAERDPIHHRWRHKPEMLFHSIKPMLKLDAGDDPAMHEQKLHERMKRTLETCKDELRKEPLGFAQAWLFERFVKLVQDYFYYRDFERFYNDKNMGRPRDFLTAIARKFIKRGLMTQEEDIFFLGKDEIMLVDDGALSARDIDLRIRSRRRVYERYAHKEPPKYIRGWETFDDNQLPDDGAGLRGIGASSGIVTGRARVCRHLSEISKIEKGDILVTVATDPGWTTVFSIIGGVVVESGGVVAHAVMISREYGIPCVANLGSACDLIPDGSIITIDGGKGRVLIHEDRPEDAAA